MYLVVVVAAAVVLRRLLSFRLKLANRDSQSLGPEIKMNKQAAKNCCSLRQVDRIDGLDFRSSFLAPNRLRQRRSVGRWRPALECLFRLLVTLAIW